MATKKAADKAEARRKKNLRNAQYMRMVRREIRVSQGKESKTFYGSSEGWR